MPKLKWVKLNGRQQHFVLVSEEQDCIAEIGIDGVRWPSAGESQHNARRLVACWNACHGIPTEMLEEVDPERQPAIYMAQAKRIVELEQACIKINTLFVYFESNLPPDKQIGTGAREALAEVHRVIGGRVLPKGESNADAR